MFSQQLDDILLMRFPRCTDTERIIYHFGHFVTNAVVIVIGNYNVDQEQKSPVPSLLCPHN